MVSEKFSSDIICDILGQDKIRGLYNCHHFALEYLKARGLISFSIPIPNRGNAYLVDKVHGLFFGEHLQKERVFDCNFARRYSFSERSSNIFNYIGHTGVYLSSIFRLRFFDFGIERRLEIEAQHSLIIDTEKGIVAEKIDTTKPVKVYSLDKVCAVLGHSLYESDPVFRYAFLTKYFKTN